MSSTTDEKDKGLDVSTTKNPPSGVSTSGVLKPPMKMLSPTDLAEVCIKIGAPPSRCVPEPTSPIGKDAPSGLYKEVISSRRRAQIMYYLTATLYNSCIVLQLLFGAALTALGSASAPHKLAITLLAAGNTVNAGLIALLHNSGLPNRIKQDWNEFGKVEMVLEEMIYTGLVGAEETKVDAVARCWDMFNTAKATIEKNKPSVYTTAPSAAALATSV